ncbi:PAS domain S-box protein [Tatlockia micdadei]|nr:hypothetical protein B6V88_08715 [Legionella micdadei]NSL17477.1 PAS domain S-box protein [Legionella micdadei]
MKTNYLVFHILVELFSIIIVITALTVATTTSQFTKNHFIIFIAIASGWCGSLDLIHMLVYKGMNLLPVQGSNVSTEFWVSARLIQALAFLISPIFLRHTCPTYALHIGFACLIIVLSWAIFHDYFPDTYVERHGLTLFKRITEWLVILILLSTLFSYWQMRALMSPRLFNYLILSLSAMALSEVFFSIYADMYGIENILGHIFKIVAYWFIYVALVITTLTQPFNVLARTASTYDTVPDPTIIMESSGQIKTANLAAAQFTHSTPESLVGLENHTLFHNPNASKSECPICSQLNKTEPFMGEINRENDGWVECSLTPISSEFYPNAWVQVIRDISDRKYLELERTNLVKELGQRIEELHRHQQALKEREHHFRAMIEQPITGIFVRDEKKFIYTNPRFLEIIGYSREELQDKNILDLLNNDVPTKKLVIEIWQQIKAGQVGVSYQIPFRRKNGKPIILGLHATAITWYGKPAALTMVQDVTELKQAQDKINRYVKQLEKAINGTFLAVSNMVELRDPYTAGHERRVGLVAKAIAEEMGWPPARCEALELIGLVHDIGKVSIPAEILSKPGKLSAMEMELVKGHARAGYEILKDIEFNAPVAETILQHHERMNGSGYPQGLMGNEILPEARIIAVADVLESMSSHRPYRPALGLEAALNELLRGRNELYDPEAVDAIVRLIREKGYVLPAK